MGIELVSLWAVWLVVLSGASRAATAHLVITGDAAERLSHHQTLPIDNESLFVDISNNMMAGTGAAGVIDVDCVAMTSSREPLDFLGNGSVKPSQAVVYYMNLKVFTPHIVSCTFDWSGMNKTLDLYDDRNIQLQYKYVRWSVMENGFSLYQPVSERFQLYKTWN